MTEAAAPHRCFWCTDSPLYQQYHDMEWGRPVEEDTRLFEKLCLEGFQAGLSWITVLRKRAAFRQAFHGFDIERVGHMTQTDVQQLLQDEGIIRHRGKIEATIHNAHCALSLQKECGSLAKYFWHYAASASDRPANPDASWLRQQTTSPQALALSRDLKKRGFKFVGPTTMYAFMQAMGLVNDHESTCYVRQEVQEQQERARKNTGYKVLPEEGITSSVVPSASKKVQPKA